MPAGASGWNLNQAGEPPSSSPSQPLSESQRAGFGKDRWILVVEDNSGDVALIRLALKHNNVQCGLVVMTDGDQACKFVDSADGNAGQIPDVIVLDLNLPKRTGREVLQRVRQSRAWRNVPVVVFSSSSADSDKQEAARLGANRYITKPSDLTEFLKVGEVLKGFMRVV